MKFPRASEQDQKEGWMICPEFLRKISGQFFCQATPEWVWDIPDDLKQIEAVLLALESLEEVKG